MSSPRRASPKKATSSKKKATSRSTRAGLTMPVGRIANKLKTGRYASRVGKGAPVFIASVLEYLVSEVIDLAGEAAKAANKKRLTPRYINLAIRGDEELSRLLHNATIAGGGVKPAVLDALKKKAKKSKKSKSKKSKDGKKKKSSSKGKKEKKSKSKSGSKKKDKKKAKKEKAATQEA
eukprot:TRINITY_DN24212_c0_g1_i1.p1 TRINITY_DN24212_c0_g1~~TRINITY_DN24212_c0_g1_i1.p1  ORF type:complete len:178 (+),score=60.56 TRINITY_DN24212_c0_g1_i1:14-547(+)